MKQKKSTLSNQIVEQLYMATLDMKAREEFGLRFPVKVYVQDPEVARYNEELGIRDILMDWEPGMMDGPTSARVAVVDYNADSNVFVEAARWNSEARRFMVDEDPTNFQFHQVNVWAIVQNTLAFYENPHVMGRPIPWGFDGNRLIVIPHAGYRRNAFYDRNSKSLQFYFFEFEGDPVYTCLSHDIVAHETGHAILDGIRPHFNAISSVQTSAFHEFLADLTAILSALRNNDVRNVVAKSSDGDLQKDDVIADLAEQFAKKKVEETYQEVQRSYLRTAHNALTMKHIAGRWEPHYCSQVLTGALFQILSEITMVHKKDGKSASRALWYGTRHLNRMALRALDYCPPVDVQFIDYARVLLRADQLAYPRDSKGYRDIVRKVFKARGLEDFSLPSIPESIEFTWKYDITQISRSRTAAYHFLNDNRCRLGIPLNQDIVVTDLYSTDKVVEAENRLPQEIVLEYLWREDVELRGDRFAQFRGKIVPLLCGGTLIFDGRANLLHWIDKPGVEDTDGERRQQGEFRRGQMLDYVAILIHEGMLRLSDGDGDGGIDAYHPVVRGQLRGGALHMEMTPHLLHTGDHRGV